MSSSDYINLLKIRNSDASKKTAGAQTQNVMMSTVVNNTTEYFQVPLGHCSGNAICYGLTGDSRIKHLYSDIITYSTGI